MVTDPKNPAGGGIFIVIGIFAGIAIGRYLGQTMIGLLGGFAVGIAIAAALWLRDRRG